MTLDEAMECDDLTRAEARQEIARHDVEGGWKAFLAEVGAKSHYTGQEVLGWLGY